LKNAGLTHKQKVSNDTDLDYLEIDDLSTRIKKILDIYERNHLNPKQMLYFVMYDIENDKVRRLISKYLEKKSCQRVQRSIFFAESDRSVYNQIKKDLQEVQETYDNNDSIFIVPVSTDQLQAMKIIGQNIDFDIIIKSKNTLFF
jgi:CRISPR-associated protein Cas2